MTPLALAEIKHSAIARATNVIAKQKTRLLVFREQNSRYTSVWVQVTMMIIIRLNLDRLVKDNNFEDAERCGVVCVVRAASST